MPGATETARNSQDGIALLERHRGTHIPELWLDHDLGGSDTIMPVVTVLEEAAFYNSPFDIGTIFVHSSNPSGAENVVRALRHWDYNVRRIAAPTDIAPEQS